MKKILYTISLMFFANLAFGQMYVDTMIYTSSGGSFSTSSLNNATHGQTVLKERNRGEKLEIHRSTYKAIFNYPFFEEEQPITLTLRYGDVFDLLYFNLPDDFTTGTDSVFMQYPKDSHSPFLYQVIELYDRRGTAKITEYHENGKVKSVLNYTADTTDFDVLAVAMVHYGDTVGLGSNYTKAEFLEDYGHDKNAIGIFDTSFVLTGFLHGEERHYYKNGNLSYIGSGNYNYTDSVCRTYYENGQIAVEQSFDNGKRVGKTTAWHENGKVKGYNYYEDDKPIGTWQEWDENGQLIKEHRFKAIKLSSKFGRGRNSEASVKRKTKEWYSNGQFKKTEKWGFDLNLGRYAEYYENGQLKAKGKYANPFWAMGYVIFWCNCPRSFKEDDSFRNGIKNGKWKYYNENGDLLTTQKYRFGFLKKEKPVADELEIFDYFNPPAEEQCRSQLIMKVEISDREYEEKTYCINRREIAWTDTFYNHIVNDLGDSTQYIFEIVDFLDKDGTVIYQRFYPDGQIMMDYKYQSAGDFEEPLKDTWRRSGRNVIGGKAYFWYANGQLKWIREYEKNPHYPYLESEISYYENGQQKSETYQSYEDEKIWRTWYESGTAETAITYDEGRKNGESLKWNEQGVLIEKLNYKDYKLHGKQFYYDDEGKLIKTEVYENGELQVLCKQISLANALLFCLW